MKLNRVLGTSYSSWPWNPAYLTLPEAYMGHYATDRWSCSMGPPHDSRSKKSRPSILPLPRQTTAPLPVNNNQFIRHLSVICKSYANMWHEDTALSSLSMRRQKHAITSQLCSFEAPWWLHGSVYRSMSTER